MKKRFVKRAAALLLAALLTAAGCTGVCAHDQPPPAYITAGSVARYIVENGAGRDPAVLERVDETRDAETVSYYITQVYGLEPESWADCAIYRAGGTEAFEIAVIRTESEKQARAAAKALEAYIEAREGDFTGYEPEQADVVHGSAAAWNEYGDAALLICEDADGAEQAFEASYEALVRIPFDPPGQDDMTLYDTSAILAAWQSGDETGLSEKDAAILARASAVLDEVTAEDMSLYQKERALYGWLTAHCTYDQDHYDKLAELDPDSFDPYGPLHNGKGVCVGFATTFQLLMDMVGVECITVVGASRESTADHAWNMVRLDGKWYCVDSTWDEGDAEPDWKYFNVTSDFMAQTNHQWDYETVPEATATDGGAGPQ